MRPRHNVLFAVAGCVGTVAEVVRLLMPNSYESGYGQFKPLAGHHASVFTLFLLACFAPSLVLAQPGGVATVNVSTVEARKVTSLQTFIGTVTPTRRAVIGSAVAGRVESVPVDDGDFVKMNTEKRVVDGEEVEVKVGQPLAQLRVKTIGILIAAARAELNLAEQELSQLETSLPEEIAQSNARLLARKR